VIVTSCLELRAVESCCILEPKIHESYRPGLFAVKIFRPVLGSPLDEVWPCPQFNCQLLSAVVKKTNSWGGAMQGYKDQQEATACSVCKLHIIM